MLKKQKNQDIIGTPKEANFRPFNIERMVDIRPVNTAKGFHLRREPQPDNIKKEIMQPVSVEAGEWIVDNSSGCKVWNPKPEPNESISWSGKCNEGTASGQGILQWYISKSGLKEDKKLQATFEGYMSNGKSNGAGTLTASDGRKYVGDFKDGKRHGNGTETRPDGAKYVGEFKDRKPNGTGTLTQPDGRTSVSEFKEGKFIRHAATGAA